MALKLWRRRSQADGRRRKLRLLRRRSAEPPSPRPAPAEPEPLVRAGGGVVRRRSKNGNTQYALVHRPRYDDWSVPKGKVDPGETDEEAALREVEEETGVRATLGPELEATRYRDRKGRLKQVRYWLMETADGKAPKFRPNDEIDEVRWCSAADAGKLLDHEHDRKLIGDAEALP